METRFGGKRVPVASQGELKTGKTVRFSERLAGLLEWNLTDKCLLVLGLFLLAAVLPAAANEVRLRHGSLPSYLDPHSVRVGVDYLWILALLTIGLLVFTLATRRRFPENRVLSLITSQYFALGASLACYALGYFTQPYTSIFYIAIPAIGFLLFPRWQVWASCGTYFVFLFALTGAERAGILPYAPALRGQPFVDGRLSIAWIGLVGGGTVAACAVVSLLLDFLVVRWRDRERRLAEAYAELSRTKDQLVRAESLAAVGALVTGAAHELRNPLSSSSGLFQSLREELGDSKTLAEEERAEALKTLDLALQGQDRAGAIVDRLYRLTDDLATGGSEALLGNFIPSLEKIYAGLEVEADKDARKLYVREALIRTVLPNLLENAKNAGGKGPVRLRISKEGEFLCFEISDTGRGIPEDLQREIFKPFVTGSKTGEGHGVGLGLYIVHELVTRMGGSVSLESREGEGTRVTVKVPVG